MSAGRDEYQWKANSHSKFEQILIIHLFWPILINPTMMSLFMTIFNLLIAICWIVFIIVWLVLSFKIKKTISGNERRHNPWLRLAILTAAVTLFFKIEVLQPFVDYHPFQSNDLAQSIGVLVCVVGVAFAIWARLHLGGNWGTPMSVKEKPDLVTTGPYRFVRHPIYTGIAVAMLGSIITVGFMWLVWFFLFSISFIYSAKKEEKFMLAQFPKEYPAYMKRTKMLIPFIF
jgi:protein-S-isoprenylcysteine O-methyltransferase Ste14